MELEDTTVRKVTRRFLPFLMVCYFVAYLDRSNIGFGALQMNADIGLSPTAYGLGAGLFFLAYCLFEVPSNLMLHRVGARLWIARIMFTWGLIAVGMAFIWNEWSFYAMRLLLGAAEAGYQPGVILFLTLWFPTKYRARVFGFFFAAVPLSGFIGAPLSGLLLGMDGIAGLRGWQWLYIVEGTPAVLLSFVVLYWLTDRPSQAKWLSAIERDWLVARMADEVQKDNAARKHTSLFKALMDPKVLVLGGIFFTNSALNNANGFFLPQVVKSFGLSNATTGLVAAIPSLMGLITVVWWSRRSDRLQERRWHAALPQFLGGVGLALSVVLPNPVLKVAALSLAVAGTFGFWPVFWTMPNVYLSGTAAAGGIAAISAMGNMGGFFAPSIVGRLQDLTGSIGPGQLIISCLAALGAICILIFGPRVAPARIEAAMTPDAQAAARIRPAESR